MIFFLKMIMKDLEEQYNQLVKLDEMIFNNKPKHLHTNQHYMINKT